MEQPTVLVEIINPLVLCDVEFGNGKKAKKSKTIALPGVRFYVDYDDAGLPIAASIIANREEVNCS